MTDLYPMPNRSAQLAATFRYLMRSIAMLASPNVEDRRNAVARLSVARRLLRIGPRVDLTGVQAQQEFGDVLRTFVPSRHSLRLLPQEFACDASLYGMLTFRFGGAIVDANRAPIGFVQRRLVLAQGVALHELLVLLPTHRGNRLGLQVIRDSLRLYDTLGITRIDLLASLETGRWYWAHLGWDFVDPAERREVLRWAAEVAAALGQPGATAGISTAFELAHLDTGTPASFEQLIAAFPARTAEIAIVAAKNGKALDAPLPLGKLIMLTGRDWLGRLDLRSPQRAILEAELLARLGAL